METIIQKLKIESPVILTCWIALIVVVICFLAVASAAFAYQLFRPDVFAANSRFIIVITIAIAAMLAAPVVSSLLYMLRHINRLHEDLKDAVRRDYLTGVMSREAFVREVQDHLDLCGDYDSSGALLMVDADYFKKINDRYGHDVGDAALMVIGKALKKGIRHGDLVGRVGGEEFAIFLKDSDGDIAPAIAERLRCFVKHAEECKLLPGLELTVSVGGILFDRPAAFEELYKAADQHLYEAKKQAVTALSWDSSGKTLIRYPPLWQCTDCHRSGRS